MGETLPNLVTLPKQDQQQRSNFKLMYCFMKENAKLGRNEGVHSNREST
jgi:hypothetical protein